MSGSSSTLLCLSSGETSNSGGEPPERSLGGGIVDAYASDLRFLASSGRAETERGDAGNMADERHEAIPRSVSASEPGEPE